MSSLSNHLGEQLAFGGLDWTLVKRPPDKRVKSFSFTATPHEYKVVSLRECPTPEYLQLVDNPERAVDYWCRHIPANPMFDPERECFVVLLLNARSRIKGHQIVSMGTLDSVGIHARDVFKLAIVTSAAKIIMAHNHPSGDSAPSDTDIRITRELIRVGQLMKIDVVDHIIMGAPAFSSLKELGFFYA
jgi:DNA repair protein RadC